MTESFLKGRIALVTASAKGVGRAIALALAKQGATVVVHFRSSQTQAQETLTEIQKFSPQSMIAQGDLTQETEVKRVFSDIQKGVGAVDILINTIGDFIWQTIGQTSFSSFKTVMESNLYTTFLCMHEVLPAMVQKKEGHIINFGSTGCERILLRPKTTPYYMAKTGVYMLTKIMAHQYAPKGIRINMISPGPLPTSVAERDTVPKGLEISYDDITNAILFLLNKNSRHIIGANIEVSGGWSPELNSV